MKKINRKSFIAKTAIGMGAMLAFPQWPFDAMANGTSKSKHPVGFQVYPLREDLAKDFAGTLKKMAKMGYQLVEMCYPLGYQKAGFAPLVNMKASAMNQIMNDLGLQCRSCHFLMSDLIGDNYNKSIEFAHDMKLTQIVCPGLDTPGKSIAEYKTAVNNLNKIAEKVKSAGMITGLHNHKGEFAMLDGELIYDAIMSELAGDLVKMQFQTEVITLGYKASTYFKKYPGRFISAHLSDWTKEEKATPIGKGIIDWKEFFETAKIGGVQNFFVEMTPENFKDSVTYIHGLLG